MPIEATLRSVTVAEDPHNIPTEYSSVLRWRDELLPTFIQNIRSGLVIHDINEYFSTAVFDISVATSLITDMYLKAFDCMSYTISNKLVPSKIALFDKECRVRSEMYINFCENTQGHITNMMNNVIFLSAVHMSLY